MCITPLWHYGKVSTQREKLVETAVDLLARDGAKALSVRKLAAAVGTSTMAVYTHFGSMAGLLEAVADEATSRLNEAVTHLPQTDDPVAQFFVVGLAYYRFALADPRTYALIMGTASTPQPLLDFRTDVTVIGRPTGRADRSASYEVLHDVVRRMIAADRIRDDGSLAMTARLWAICHGAVSLDLAGYFGHDGHGLTEVLGPLAVDTIVGMGDTREKAMQSLATAMESLDPRHL
jgi:AcrR family transcriptional regulator